MSNVHVMGAQNVKLVDSSRSSGTAREEIDDAWNRPKGLYLDYVGVSSTDIGRDGWVITLSNGGTGYGAQIFVEDGSSPPSISLRNASSKDVWSEWQKVYTPKNKPTADDLGLGSVLTRLAAIEAKLGITADPPIIDGPSMEEDMDMDDMTHAGGYNLYIVTCLPALIGGVRHG